MNMAAMNTASVSCCPIPPPSVDDTRSTGFHRREARGSDGELGASSFGNEGAPLVLSNPPCVNNASRPVYPLIVGSHLPHAPAGRPVLVARDSTRETRVVRVYKMASPACWPTSTSPGVVLDPATAIDSPQFDLAFPEERCFECGPTMEARSAAAEMLKKTDAGGAKRYRHDGLGIGSEVVEEVKVQRLADALLSGSGRKKRKRDADQEEDDGSVSYSGGEGPQPVKPPWLSPMPPLQRLLNACRAVFTGSSCTPPTLSAVAFIRGIMDRIGPNDVGLKDEVRFFNRMNTAGRQNPPIITCKPIYEGTNFTIAVFFLPLGAVMPLHDHPGMTVFTKLLIGSAHLEAYDWVRPVLSAGLDSHSHSRRRMLAEKVRDHDVTAAASGSWVLFPNYGGNMHRFTAAEDAHCAFLDVLTPPMDQRRCAYYQDFEFPYEHHPPSCKSSTGGSCAGLIAEQQTRRLAWLEEVPQPRDLRIVCLPYRGPTIF